MMHPGVRLRAVRRAGTAALTLALVLFIVTGAFTGRASSQPSPRAAASGISFSHAVVVDHQHPGFEPDVKVATDGTIFTSVPFGFSTTESFVWSSRDAGNSYQFVPGDIATTGKQATCFGGGDSDLYLDAKNSLYFSDLQGLTNISNSRSDDGGSTWSTTCAGAPNTPDDRMWFAGTGSFSGGDLNLYQDFDAVDSSVTGGNQLVETESHDGASTFQPVVNTSPDSTCLGAALQDCVTGNEGISGNQVADPATGNVYVAHTTTEGSSGTPGVRVAEGSITQGTPPTATWTESPNLDGSLCPDSTCTDSSGNPEEIAGENFATIARDSAGYLYVTFTAGPIDHNSNDPNFGGYTAPEQIYVVHSLAPAGANPAAVTWSAPQRITGGGLSAGTNTFPWITAGSDGRVAVAWYHTNEVSEQGPCVSSGSGSCTLYGAGFLQNAEWSVQMGQSLDAHDASPAYTTADVSEAFVKHGPICTNGIGCATGGDRSLGDFLQIATDNQGAAVISYVFDTSQDTSDGEDSGPEVVSRQITGPSLLASAGTVSQGGGPGTPMGSVTDPTGDDFYSSGGTRTPGGGNLDLTGASLGNGTNRTLIGKIDVGNLTNLTPNSSAGGSDASWILRWTDVVPGTTGNGHIYYLGMDNNQGANGSGKPSFFVGDTSAIPPPGNPADHTKYITYPQTKTLSSSQASYDAKTGVISFQIPLSDVGNPANGTVLYSGTAFSATSGSPQSPATLFNLIDATTPFELVIGPPGTVGASPTGPPAFTSPNNGKSGACSPATGRLSHMGLGKLRLRMKRATARQIYPRWSTRGRRYMEFYCLSPNGIRAGYPSNTFLRSLPRKVRRAVKGRAVMLLTANRHYALHGVRPNARLSKVRKRLHVSRPFRIGLNTWYLTPNGASHGLIKVQHGIIEEVGIVDRMLTSRGHGQNFRFLNSFRSFL
jgi:hypothetical protein